MNEEKFTLKQVLILVLVIIIVIAFLETPANSEISTWVFWREFLLKIFIYGGVCEFIVYFVGYSLD
jgi:hypothetical protein